MHKIFHCSHLISHYFSKTVVEKKTNRRHLSFKDISCITYRHDGRLFHITFVPLSHGVSIFNLALIGKAVFEKIFDNGGRRTDARGYLRIERYFSAFH